ncbi:hypothetical protein NGB36_29195 [Streptomyces sp. RB6PN25]|uniref:Uncharacterized protein n=1 Tax=Streptomyces humicola TaxID=2953240 RepID=A0ABT1Q3N4_9ACTN|nr:hypothetical protein [Streptomyces humicola]MCQ4084541.1 hypothetical protein [Streptomyces humicola]
MPLVCQARPLPDIRAPHPGGTSSSPTGTVEGRSDNAGRLPRGRLHDGQVLYVRRRRPSAPRRGLPPAYRDTADGQIGLVTDTGLRYALPASAGTDDAQFRLGYGHAQPVPVSDAWSQRRRRGRPARRGRGRGRRRTGREEPPVNGGEAVSCGTAGLCS